MNKDIFKSYDIRGLYPSELDGETVYRVARATAEHFSLNTVAIGRDMRASSPSLLAELVRGFTESGVNVIDLGLASTPMVYFASSRLSVDAGVALTASHNPGEYAGMKICLRDAVPVGLATGLADIRDRTLEGDFSTAEKPGSVKEEDIKPEYLSHLASFLELGEKKFTIAIDTANAMGILELPVFEQFEDNLSLVRLYDDMDRAFTCHEANPLKTETLDELREKVKESGADIGFAYDGDADRIGFVDETGEVVPMDLMTALIAREVLEKKPGATILYDLRSSRAVREVIEESGGRAVECQVGHANIKRMMREEKAVFAGELSGHYYFEENSMAEASTLAAIMPLNLMAETGKPLSELVADIRRYHHSGEINSEVEDKDAILAALEDKYSDGEIGHLDGLKVDYADWWFNVRPSNTEPLLRLNLEAKTPELLAEKQAELLAIIRG